MEQVLLGLAAPAVVGTAGNLVERSLASVAEPFATVFEAIAEALSLASDEPAALVTGDLQSELAARIASTLAAAGIDLSEPIELRLSSTDGQLEVIGEHSQKALIESALADVPDLARKFTEFAAHETGVTVLFRRSGSA